jgi:PIN domain nuclease of toxin-antitoxin system
VILLRYAACALADERAFQDLTSGRKNHGDVRTKGSTPFISILTLWEIALLHSKGRVRLPVSLPKFVKHLERIYVVLPITSDIVLRAAALTRNFPKDPADRLIAATALERGVPLVTSDMSIRQSGEVPCIW